MILSVHRSCAYLGSRWKIRWRGGSREGEDSLRERIVPLSPEVERRLWHPDHSGWMADRLCS